LPRILITSPFESNATDTGTNFNPAVQLISALPCRADYLRAVPSTFEPYRIILIADSQLATLGQTQVAELRNFLHTGGRLVLFCFSQFAGTVEAVNRLSSDLNLWVA